jgi:CotH kinase protein
MHAFNNTLANLDSYLGKLSHNYYVYRDTFGIWQPIIWDLNLCFGGFRLDGIEANPLSNEKLQNISPMAHATDAQFPLLSQLLKNDLYKKLYIAHIRTILNENFVSNAFYTRAREVQSQIDFYVKEDKNKLYSYEAFKQNMDASADAGKSKIIGITELMQKRTEILKAHPLLAKAPPKINEYRQIYNGDKIQIACRLENGQKAVLYYRAKKNAPFKTMDFKDDGYQGDGAAMDGLLGLQLLKKDCAQYYIMAINADAASVLPERASYEFFEVR